MATGDPTATSHSGAPPPLTAAAAHCRIRCSRPRPRPRWLGRYTIKSGAITFAAGSPTGALPGKLVRNRNLAARASLPGVPPEFVDYRRAVVAESEGMDAAAQLDKSLDAEAGISHASRVSQKMEEEAAKRAAAPKM